MKRIFSASRADQGIGERFKEGMAALPAGAEPDTSVYERVADWIFAWKETQIRARFARGGWKPPEDGPLTVAAIRDMVRARSGLDVDTLSPDGVMHAVDKELAAQLSQRLGFAVSTVFNAEQAKQEVKAQVLEKLADGTAGGIIQGRALSRLRAVATFARAGFTPDERKKALGRLYQKRYRRKNREVWAD